MNKLIKPIVFFIIVWVLSFSNLNAQDLPYRISMDGLNTLSLELLKESSPLLRFDSIVFENEQSMQLSYKLRQLERMYQPMNEKPAFDLRLGAYPYISNFSEFTLLDKLSLDYESYRYSFEFEHGYFGPARRPKASQNIPKSIYRDLLYPWQNAPQSKFQTYKALYLIITFVYPTE